MGSGEDLLNAGGFEWKVAVGFQSDVDREAADDPQLRVDLMGWMNEAKRTGAREELFDTYEPLEMPAARNMAMGEWRLDGELDNVYRLYFVAPRDQPLVLLALGFHLKGPDELGNWTAQQNAFITICVASYNNWLARPR